LIRYSNSHLEGVLDHLLGGLKRVDALEVAPLGELVARRDSHAGCVSHAASRDHARSAIARSAIGRGTIARSAVDRGSAIGRGTIARSAVDRGAITRCSITSSVHCCCCCC